MSRVIHSTVSYSFILPIKGSQDEIQKQFETIFSRFEKDWNVKITEDDHCMHMGDHCGCYPWDIEPWKAYYGDQCEYCIKYQIKTTLYEGKQHEDEDDEDYENRNSVDFPYKQLKEIIGYFHLDWNDLKMKIDFM